MNNDEEDIYKVDDEEGYEVKEDKKNDLGSKLIKYGIIAFVILIIFVLLMAILSPKKTVKKEIATKNVTLTIGDKYSTNYSKGQFTWISSNEDVVKVSNDGEIIALKNGDATITIKSGSETVEYKVHVDKIEETTIVTNVKMEKNTIELEVGKTYDMKVVFTPSNASNIELSWISSNENVVKVNNGEIKALASGTSIVTVKTPNGNTDYCLVKVLGDGKFNPVESISIKSTDVSLDKGSSYNLSYDIVPSESINLIIWESSNEDIVTVENGVVYAHSSGEAKVTAKSGDISKTISVTVNEEKVDPLPKVILNYNNVGLEINEEFTLVVNDNIPVTWTSSNEEVATVDENGKVVAIKEGETTITATAGTGMFDECTVVVSKRDILDSISLNSNSVSLNVGERAILTATVTPSNNVSGIVWSSSNANVATVENGVVTAVANGTATIKATLPNGGYAECSINVTTKVINVLSVKININSVTLNVGDTTQLTATVAPSNATNKTITWSSSNDEIATVDKNGKVTAKKKGSVKIYARSSNGVVDDCAIIVK